MSGVKLVISDDHAGLEQPGELSWAVFPGNDAIFTYSKMLVLMCPNKAFGSWWQQIYGPYSMHRTVGLQKSSCKLRSKNMRFLCLGCQPGWSKIFLKGLQFSIFLLNTEDPSGQPTAWSGSTRRSEEGQAWLVFFRTRLRV